MVFGSIPGTGVFFVEFAFAGPAEFVLAGAAEFVLPGAAACDGVACIAAEEEDGTELFGVESCASEGDAEEVEALADCGWDAGACCAKTQVAVNVRNNKTKHENGFFKPDLKNCMQHSNQNLPRQTSQDSFSRFQPTAANGRDESISQKRRRRERAAKPFPFPPA
jgi:hypothetical protein